MQRLSSDQALRWATRNLEIRQTAEAYDLALTAALRAHDAPARCAIAGRAAHLAVRTIRLDLLISEGLGACRDGAGPGAGGHVAASR
jgi:hypothetical protein